MKIYGYKKCSTCLKAIKHYEQNNEVEFFDFVQNQIPKDVLLHLIEKSQQPIDNFFNSRGVLFKEMNLKNKLLDYDNNKKIELLLSDGKLIKRPIIEIKDEVIIGFKPNK